MKLKFKLIETVLLYIYLLYRQLERKFSEQNLDAPPSYEEAVADVQSPVHDERFVFFTKDMDQDFANLMFG